MSHISKRLKEFRVAVGLTQRELASICGVGKRSIIYWEMGQRAIGITKLKPLATDYDLNFNWLLMGTGSMFIDHKISDDPPRRTDSV